MSNGKVGADDFVRAGAKSRDMEDLPRVEVDPRPALPAEPADLKGLMPEVLQAVRAWNLGQGPSPRIYNVDGEVRRLDWGPIGDPLFVPLDRERALVLLAEAIRWDRAARKKMAPRVPALPPRHAIDGLRAEPASFWPAFRRFVAAPFFRPDGSLVTTPGYDRATGLYYAPATELRVPLVPASPSPTEILAARAIVDEMLVDFCWRDATVDPANAYAIMLTPIIRPFYTGHTPLAAISKTVGRAGAGLLLDTLLFPALGRCLPRTSAPEKAEEMRKSLFALARERDEAVLFDNVDGPMDQSPLAAFLTSDRIRDRILGLSQAATVAELPLLYATGVGITLSSEMAPRVCLVELDPRVERPEERTDFQHAPLRAWIAVERGRLLGACLTLVQATIAQGWPMPTPRPMLGDFQEWADRVASVLGVAGIPGFLQNRARLREADPVGDAWRLLMRRARQAFAGPTPDATLEFTAGLLWPQTGWKREERERAAGGGSIPDPDVPRFLGAPDVPLPLGLGGSGGDKSIQTSWGIALRRRVGQIFDGWVLEYVGDDHNAKVYRLTRAKAEPAWVTDVTTGDDAGGASDGAC